MKKLNLTTLLLILTMFSLLIVLSGCNNNAQSGIGKSVVDLSSGERVINVDKIEVVNFHATNRCYSCITLGNYAKETIETYFKEELKEGIIEFKEIDALLTENREITIKYGPTSSSVWIGVYEGDNFSAIENTNLLYKLRNKQDFMDYLKGVIEQKLAGN